MATIEVKVPDIGDFESIPVIEVLVKVGDTVEKEQSLVTLESDKATMEVPASEAGVVRDIKLKVGDKVSMGTLVLTLETSAAAPVAAAATSAPAPVASTPAPVATVAPASPKPAAQISPSPAIISSEFKLAHASPSVRKFARELGVDLSLVEGSAEKGRITQADVQAFVKGALSGGTTGVQTAATGGGAALGLIPWPKVDFAKFGTIESKPLSRIKKLSGANLHRNWVMIPHVTNHDEADITELEAFRVQLNKENEKSGVKVSMLSFMI